MSCCGCPILVYISLLLWLPSSSCPVLSILYVSHGLAVMSRLSCPSCPGPGCAVLSQLCCPRCLGYPVLAVLCRLSWFWLSVPADMSQLFCPCCPVVPAVLLSLLSCLKTKLSYPDCSVPTVFSQLSCPRCPVPTVLSRLSCPNCSVLAVPS